MAEVRLTVRIPLGTPLTTYVVAASGRLSFLYCVQPRGARGVCGAVRLDSVQERATPAPVGRRSRSRREPPTERRGSDVIMPFQLVTCPAELPRAHR
jgi:hypothetical protein